MSEILIGISAGLLGEQVRHDGGHGRNGFLLEELAPHGARRPIGRDLGAWLNTLGAFLAFALSVVLWFTDSRQEALFTGLPVPSMLALGAFYAALRRHST
jgi:hypothetical protein